jgi:RNA polymerase II subunit A small phosphatase-like protein
MERRRNGSVASSKRSVTSPGATQANASKANATSTQSTPMQKPKKSGGFLGFLNCCGASDSANGAEDEAPMPVKKVPKVGSRASPQTTSSKPESIPLQPVTGRPTGSLPEKSSPQPSETVQNPAIDQEDVSQTPLRSKQENHQGSLDLKASSKDIRNQPLPALPQEADNASRDQNSSSNPSVIVQAPTPVRPKQEDSASPPPPRVDQGNALSDIEMTDAPPITTVETKAVAVNHRDAQTNATILPPPPPLPCSDTSKDSTNAPQETTTAEPVEEKQQWLLPPIEPRFQGKKCLVLDLDETLVHSSFKVLSTP